MAFEVLIGPEAVYHSSLLMLVLADLSLVVSNLSMVVLTYNRIISYRYLPCATAIPDFRSTREEANSGEPYLHLMGANKGSDIAGTNTKLRRRLLA